MLKPISAKLDKQKPSTNEIATSKQPQNNQHTPLLLASPLSGGEVSMGMYVKTPPDSFSGVLIYLTF
jgi:hypothetical protein